MEDTIIIAIINVLRKQQKTLHNCLQHITSILKQNKYSYNKKRSILASHYHKHFIIGPQAVPSESQHYLHTSKYPPHSLPFRRSITVCTLPGVALLNHKQKFLQESATLLTYRLTIMVICGRNSGIKEVGHSPLPHSLEQIWYGHVPRPSVCFTRYVGLAHQTTITPAFQSPSTECDDALPIRVNTPLYRSVQANELFMNTITVGRQLSSLLTHKCIIIQITVSLKNSRIILKQLESFRE